MSLTLKGPLCKTHFFEKWTVTKLAAISTEVDRKKLVEKGKGRASTPDKYKYRYHSNGNSLYLLMGEGIRKTFFRRVLIGS